MMMRIIGKLYVNGELKFQVFNDKTLKLVSLKKGDLIDIINETCRTFDETEIIEAGFYHFGIKKDGTVFLIRGW